MPFIHQLPQGPVFTWQADQLEPLLGAVRYQQGRLLGRLDALGLRLRDEATLRSLTLDVLKSSEIEVELLPAESVRSSLARRLGLDADGAPAADRRVEGIVAMLLDATQHHAQPLTAERLFAWHGALFPTGRSGLYAVEVGQWRTGGMQVVSGAMGRERVHFEAPPAEQLPAQMQQFLAWFNAPAGQLDAVLKAAVAHLWFVTIHPFDDGNGRIARALADQLLARADGSAQRGYSMSAQIQAERATYYALLERTQRGSLDITLWLMWFLECLGRADCRADPARCAEPGPLLGAPQPAAVQRAATLAATPFARRLRGQAHVVQVGKNGQVLTGYGRARYPRPARAGHPAAGSRRRPQHQLRAGIARIARLFARISAHAATHGWGGFQPSTAENGARRLSSPFRSAAVGAPPVGERLVYQSSGHFWGHRVVEQEAHRGLPQPRQLRHDQGPREP